MVLNGRNNDMLALRFVRAGNTDHGMIVGLGRPGIENDLLDFGPDKIGQAFPRVFKGLFRLLPQRVRT